MTNDYNFTLLLNQGTAIQVMKTIVAPSILSADFCNLQRDCQNILDLGADWLHIDIMDGHFVPNLTIGPPIVKSLRSCLPPKTFLDCHLMIENPELWVKRIWESGASSITFHLESTIDPISLAKRIKSFEGNCSCGLALKPSTPVSSIPPELFDLLDMILVMTVEPGFGGQKLIPECIEKIRELRNAFKFDKLIQVDGGVDEENFQELLAAGANVLVAGSSIFTSNDPGKVIAKFKNQNHKLNQ